MANPRVYAGFYIRYDEKIVYVITTAKDTDTGEETVIFFNYDYSLRYPMVLLPRTQ